jgi:hypothetical protein
MTTESMGNGDVASQVWRRFYRVGAIAAFVGVLVMISEIVITFLPGGGRVHPENVTVVNWFELFQDNWFLGLRNLGLINMIATTLLIPTVVALLGALRAKHGPWAMLALLLSLGGTAVYLGGNTGLAMLSLSHQYAAAAGEAQRMAIEAAGRAMLALGESHTPGTFVAFLLIEFGGLLNSFLMLRSAHFARATAVAGLLGNAALLAFEIASAFIPALFDASLLIAGAGGVLSLVWYVMTGRDLLRLGRGVPA